MIRDIIRDEEFKLGADGQELTAFQSKIQTIINQRYSLRNCPDDNNEYLKRAFLNAFFKDLTEYTLSKGMLIKFSDIFRKAINDEPSLQDLTEGEVSELRMKLFEECYSIIELVYSPFTSGFFKVLFKGSEP